ncbi:MAG: AsmA family protein, partial [Rhodospirillales bacterium]|nr:AsmA family protein [Rhodospirillales bacterium]
MKSWMKALSILVVLGIGGMVAGIAILKSLDFNEYRGLIAEQVKGLTGRDLTINGSLNLEISLNPAVAVEDVTFANASWGTEKEMASLKRLAAEVELLPLLSGDIRIKRVVLDGLDLLIETDAKGRGNWEISAAKTKTKSETSASSNLPEVQKVRIKDLTLTYRDGRTGEKTSLRLDHLDLQAETAAAPMIIGVGGAVNDLAFKADGRLGSIKTLIDGGAPYPVSLAMTVPGLSLNIEGAISEPRQARGLDFKVSVDAEDIAAVAKSAGVSLPEIPPVRVTGRLRDPKGGYSVENLVASVGDINLQGRAAVKLTGVARPTIDADLMTASTIDLGALLPKQKSSSAPKVRVFPGDPLPLAGLKAVDARLQLAIKRLVQNAIAVDDIKLSLVLNSGRLDVKSLTAVVNGGTVDASLVVDGSVAPSALAVNLDVRGTDYGALLQQLKLTDIATGKVDVTLNVKGRGASVRAIMAGLNGHARAVSQGGKIDSGLLNIVSSDILAALPFINSKGDKEIRCAVLDFNIRGGQANAKTLVFETGGMSMIGTGDINLKDETLALRVDPRAKKVSLLKIAMFPVNVGGTLAAPSVLPDMGGAVVGAVTGAVSTAKDIAS